MSNTGGKSTPQSVDEMLVTMEKTKNDQLTKYPGKSTYRRDNSEHSKHEIQKMLNLSIAEMADYGTKEPVKMEDTETIKARTILYLKCCQETATMPSMIGLCRSIGYTDRAARYWRRKHADHPTALWLESFRLTISYPPLLREGFSIISSMLHPFPLLPRDLTLPKLLTL